MAIVEAAKALMQEGVTPTVAQAAERGLVSRTTAYRYFPTQESLLLEVSVNLDVDDIEALVATPIGDEGATGRVRQVLSMLNEHVLADEVRYRTAMRLYQELWLAAAAAGDSQPVVREGRRKRWLAESTAPLVGTVPDAELRRLLNALAMVAGAEAMIALRDTAQLEADEALEVAAWAAGVLIDEVAGRSRPPS